MESNDAIKSIETWASYLQKKFPGEVSLKSKWSRGYKFLLRYFDYLKSGGQGFEMSATEIDRKKDFFGTDTQKTIEETAKAFGYSVQFRPHSSKPQVRCGSVIFVKRS